MGLIFGDSDDDEEVQFIGMGDPYIQKLLMKDSELSKLWNDVGSMVDEKVQPKTDKKEK